MLLKTAKFKVEYDFFHQCIKYLCHSMSEWKIDCNLFHQSLCSIKGQIGKLYNDEIVLY